MEVFVGQVLQPAIWQTESLPHMLKMTISGQKLFRDLGGSIFQLWKHKPSIRNRVAARNLQKDRIA